EAISGKPGYAAPEAVRPVSARPAEDVYGWGVVVAECLLGRRLFEEAQLAQAAARPDAPLSAAVLGPLGPLVLAALRRDPEARQTAAAISEQVSSLPMDRGRLALLVTKASPLGARESGAAAARQRQAVPARTLSDPGRAASLTPTAP